MSEKFLLNELSVANDGRIKDAINRVLRVRITYNDKKPHVISNRRGYKTRYILPVAYDQAGNCNISANIESSNYVSYTVDLDSDRPTIKFQNLSSATGSYLKYTTELTGTITDDDGVSKLKIANNV